MTLEHLSIDVGNGVMPVVSLTPDLPANAPAVVVIPSIFGPAPDLIERLAPVSSLATVLVTDPFWRVGPGSVPYDDFPTAMAKVNALDRSRAIEDVAAVVKWVRPRCNGQIVGLGICFGGPFCLMGAADGWFQGIVTWHGSRMQNYLERADEMKVPMSLHFGDADDFVPNAVVEQVRNAFAGRHDVDVVVHNGCGHGFSHDGKAWDASAAAAGLEGLKGIVRSLGS